jgi:hypothetical protein
MIGMDDPISDLFAMHQPEQGDPPKKSKVPFISKKSSLAALVLVLMFGSFAAGFYLGTSLANQDNVQSNAETSAVPITQAETKTDSAENSTLLTLDANKDYGDKYADGILPVGDDKFVTDKAKKGSVYLCKDTFVPDTQAGAQVRGPWFVNNNTEWDINKKATVTGEVSWDNVLKSTITGKNRIIQTNNLPEHTTGEFPVASSDEAYQFDRNPNKIAEQDHIYTLAASPTAGEPRCMGGEAGILLTGAALFNAFDAGGRDAGAWEVQDACDGHPQNSGVYHYHTLSRCITDISVSTVIGFALDGIPITGPKVGEKNILTTSDLDECHGIVSEILLDDKKVKTYHYVMTQDFPYSVSCFRAEPIDPPGQHGAAPNENPGAQPTRRPN